MVRIRRTYVDGPFGQAHVRYTQPTSRRGPPLVCFHATPLSSRSYERFMERIGTDRAVFAIDTPGYGESDRPPAPLSIPEYADAMLAAIDALGLAGEIDLLGMHTGTRLVVEAALARPTMARRLVFVGCAVYTEEERLEQQRTSFDLEIPKPEDAGGAQVARLWSSFESYRRVGVTDAMMERQMSEILRDREFSSWAHVGVYQHDLRPRLPLLAQPVLVINADDDLYVPTKRAPGLLRHGRLVDLSPAGFGVLEVQADRCAGLVRQFLDDAHVGAASGQSS
jgi:pimeloyl-ACP methyl ester carboxylesterase